MGHTWCTQKVLGAGLTYAKTASVFDVLPQDTTRLIQRPRYQRGSPCQDPAGNRTTRRRPDHRKETQTAVVWSCPPVIRSGQNHLARHSERGKETRQREEEVGRQHQGMDRPGVWQVPEGIGEQGKMEKTGCKIICGAPTTLGVKGLMMMTMITHWVYLSRNMCSILCVKQCHLLLLGHCRLVHNG